MSILVTSLIVFPRSRYKDGVPVARQTPDPRLRNRRCKDGVPAVRQTPDPRPLVFPRRRCHAFDCGSFCERLWRSRIILFCLHEFSGIQWLWHALVWTDMAACMHIWAMAHSHLESNLPVQNTHGKPSIS